tara:strand:- start:412 stop:1524 length:1113 start_codon:yes stop_codon:yes gene_type:complete
MIVITEISSKSEPEWIEIFNAGNTPVPLSGWKFVGYNGHPGNTDCGYEDDKWIDFDLCYQGQGGWTGTANYCNNDCILPPGEFLVVYESPSPCGGLNCTDIYDKNINNFPNPDPPCYVMGYNDSNQPANTSNHGCGDYDCSHQNGDCDLIALFPSNISPPTNNTTGKWTGNYTNAHTYVQYTDDGNTNVGGTKSISLTDPYNPNSWTPTTFSNNASPGYPTPDYEQNFVVEGLVGDTNLDGVVNVVDIVQIVNHVLGSNNLVGQALQNADVNSDGTVNVVDIVNLVNSILGPNTTQGNQIINQLTTQQTPIPPVVTTKRKGTKKVPVERTPLTISQYLNQSVNVGMNAHKGNGGKRIKKRKGGYRPGRRK